MPPRARIILAALACIIGAIAAPPASALARQPAQPARVSASVASPEMYVGQTQHLVIEWTGSDQAEAPDLSGVADFEVGNLVQTQSGGTVSIIINGRQVQGSGSHASRSFQYDIRPRRAGQLTIPSLAVHVGGKTFHTGPINVRVVEPPASEDARLEMRTDAKQAYVGQPLRLTTTWTFAGTPYQPAFDMPTPEGCDIIAPPDPRPTGARPDDPRFTLLQIHGEHVIAVIGNAIVNDKPGRSVTFDRILIPRRPGVLTIGPARVDYSVLPGGRAPNPFDMFFDDRTPMERRAARADAISIPIRALPEHGKPDNFSGLVGTYKIFAAPDTRRAAVGEPIPLRVSVTGPAPLSLVPPLDLRRQGSFDPREFRIPRTPILGEVRGNAMVFETSIRARTEGQKQIPPLELPYFDPATGAYAIARSNPIDISITPSPSIGLPPEDDDGEEVAPAAQLPGGVIPINRAPPEAASWLDRPSRPQSPLVIGALATPPLLFALAMCVVSGARLSRTDPDARRRRLALRHALTGLAKGARLSPDRACAAVSHAVGAFVADWLGRPARSLTAADADKLLRSHVSSGLADESERLLAFCDSVRFGTTAYADPAKALSAAESLLRRLDRALRSRGSRGEPRSAHRAQPRISEAIVAALAMAAYVSITMPARGSTDASSVETIFAASSVWTEALTAYDQGVARLAASAPSGEAFAKAADRFETLAGDAGVSWSSRARAWQNAGTAALLAGQAPRAILNLRRAQSINPFLTGLDENLAAARLKAEAGVPTMHPSLSGQALAVAMHASLALPRGIWFLLTLVPLSLACLVAGVRQVAPQSRWRAGPIASLLIAIAAIGGLGLSAHSRFQARSTDAVVMSVTPARQGPDAIIFAPGATLRPGTEVRVLERRAAATGESWVRVDGPETGAPGGDAWLPASTLGFIETAEG